MRKHVKREYILSHLVYLYFWIKKIHGIYHLITVIPLNSKWTQLPLQLIMIFPTLPQAGMQISFTLIHTQLVYDSMKLWTTYREMIFQFISSVYKRCTNSSYLELFFDKMPINLDVLCSIRTKGRSESRNREARLNKSLGSEKWKMTIK